jgi:hypothetical protein
MTFTRFVLAATVALLPLLAYAQPRGEVMLLAEGDTKTMQTWEVSRQRWGAQPTWTPSSSGSPPLPIAKAVELGEGWLRKRHADVKQFAVSSVALRPQSSSGQDIVDGWYYRLEFQPVVAGQRLWGGQFVAVVLFDGTVVEPRSEPYGTRRN